jgi:glycosyltransferase involved in cell wall biosynthesis
MPEIRQHAPKILLVAEHASAVFGGEALIPFQYFKRLRELRVDVHLLVHQRTQEELRDSFPNDLERLHFVADSFVNVWCHRIAKWMPDRIAVFTVGAISHLDTQIRQRRRVRLLARARGFDLVHEPIPVSPKLPSAMFGIPVPVVIGPMNGGMDYPPNYNSAGRFERFIIAGLRWSARFWNSALPGKREAALLLVANKRTREALPAKLKEKRVVEFVENGVDLDLFRPELSAARGEKFRIIYVGRLVDLKRVDLLLEACARLIGAIDFELDVVGDGPMRGDLDEQARRLLLLGRVRFHGRLSHSATADLLREADVMVLPSICECGGAVVLEAMASGVPVIAQKWGGPADYITGDTGILIPPATPALFVAELNKAIRWMANNPEARIEMGRACRRRAATLYDWRTKAKALLKIYEDVLNACPSPMRATTR